MSYTRRRTCSCRRAHRQMSAASHFERSQYARSSSGPAQVQAVSCKQISWIDLIRAQLHVTENAERGFEPNPPLAHRPIVPIASDDIAWRRAAERKIHELARESGEIQAGIRTPDLPVQHSIEIFLIVPELGPAPGLPAAIEFLNLLKRIKFRIGAEIVTVPVGDRYLELRLRER